MRSCGGKSPRPAESRGVLQAGVTVVEEAVTPQAHGMAVALQLGSDLTIGWLVGLRCLQDEATT